VRRVVAVTLLVGLFSLALGVTIGFAVALRQRFVDPGWLEAVGTWVGAGVTLLAVILGAIAYFSEEFARRRERRRQADATEDARRTEQQRLQLAADHVFCNISYAGTAPEVGPARVAVEELVIDVDNRSGSVVTYVVCELHLAAFEWSKVITEPIDTGKTVKRFPLLGPLEVRQDGRDLRANAVFTFSLNGYRWSRRHGEPAVRLSELA
jgi:hypothetical protein